MMRKVLATPVMALVAASLSVTVAAATHGTAPPTPTRKNLAPVVRRYLREHGNFCLGKFEWPIPVSPDDIKANTNNAIQMPVLEKLGVVTAFDAASDPTIKEYALTDAGKKYYVLKDVITLGPAGQKIKHPGDLCPAQLSLDKVTSWEPPAVVDGQTQTTVKFTYKVVAAADWARDPEVKRVFPMIPKILESAGSLELMQVFNWTEHGWVAVTAGQ